MWRTNTRDVGAIEGRSVSDTGSGMGDIGGGGRHGHGHGRFDLDSVDHELVGRRLPTDGRCLNWIFVCLANGVLHVDPSITHHLTPTPITANAKSTS